MEERRKEWLSDRTAELVVIVFIVILAMFCCSCRCTKTGVVEIVRTDTITNTEKVVEYVPETIYVTVPVEGKERTTKDSVSHLETSYATSNARINADGTLYHDLNNKAGARPVETKAKVVTQTKTQRINHNTTRTVTVEKRLSLWKQMKIRLFPWLLLLCIGLLLYVFRKPIGKLVKGLV